jgi:regulator of sigma E protease
MGTLIQVLQMILALSLLVVLHELGHFIPAKLFKTRVEKFYLFFDWKFSLFKIKKGDTEYGIGWIPLGGYVKISGMIDESMDKEQLSKPPESWEFRSKPAWQRLIIMLGGVIMNVILAMAIYIGLLYFHGEKYLPNSEAKYGIVCDSLAQEFGFQNGDKILNIGGDKVENFHEIPMLLSISSATNVEIERNGKIETLNLSNEDLIKLRDHEELGFIEERMPFFIGKIENKSINKNSGIKIGDLIISVNGKETPYYDLVKDEFDDNKGKEVNLGIVRNTDSLIIPVKLNKEGLIGVKLDYDTVFNLAVYEYTFAQAVPAGIKKTFKTLGEYWQQLKLMVNPETKAYKHVGSLITLTKILPTEWDWYFFWKFTAFISIILAIMNLLPIPALDGGHVMFTLYEMIARRKPGEKFMEYAQLIGMIIIIALMVFALGNDVWRHIINK